MTSRTYTLFLLKDGTKSVKDALTELAVDKINFGTVDITENAEFAEDATVYVIQNPPTRPKWMTQLDQEFEIGTDIRNQNSSAILSFKIENRIFVVTFGYGWMCLDPAKIVPDFGLRVALNAADDDKLKRLDIANLGEATRGVTQSASQRRFETFGLDEALELVRKIGGAVRDEDFGSSVTGSNSLRINGEMELKELPELAKDSLNYYKSKEYQKTAFRVIDNICPELDITKIESLDDAAASSISQDKQEFELGLPEFSEHDIASFSFVGFRHRNQYADLQLSHYTEILGSSLSSLNGSNLRHHKVKATYLDTNRRDRLLTIHDALVGSLTMAGERYAINEGNWYKVDTSFKNGIDASFQKAIRTFDVRPPAILTRVSEDSRKQSLESEGKYNEKYAKSHNLLLMDKVFISVPGFARSEFEVCDLLDYREKRLIHVKMSGRKSSILSHFFKQGANSARLMKTVTDVWPNTIAKIEKTFGADIANKVQAAMDDESRPWTVEFHIADSPRADGSFNIPFFSRVTFREEEIQLRAMGYRVFVKFIPKPNVKLRI